MARGYITIPVTSTVAPRSYCGLALMLMVWAPGNGEKETGPAHDRRLVAMGGPVGECAVSVA